MDSIPEKCLDKFPLPFFLEFYFYVQIKNRIVLLSELHFKLRKVLVVSGNALLWELSRKDFPVLYRSELNQEHAWEVLL